MNTGSTPYVGYGYDTTASSGVFTKGSRPTTLTYPNARVVTRNYSGIDDTISRLSSLTDGGTTSRKSGTSRSNGQEG